MPNLKIVDMTGKEVGTIELSDAVFAAEPNQAVHHAAVRSYLLNQRQGTQSTKTRSEVSGGGKKPWRQKGSGRARQLREYIEIMRDKIAPHSALGLGDIPYAEGQVMYLCAETAELCGDTGYVPDTPFEEGIDKTIEWYKQERKKAK